jgi:hypothetical protein
MENSLVLVIDAQLLRPRAINQDMTRYFANALVC